MVVLVQHDGGCPMKGKGHSDAAKRVYDMYHLHRTADMYGARGKWIAVALADGTSDGTLYDNKKEAVRHQHHNEQYYTYIQITQANMTVCSAEVMLTLTRRLYDKGMRITDPDDRSGGRQVIQRVSYEDQVAQARMRPGNLLIPKE